MTTEVLAPMPGKVVKLLCDVGDTVAEDDELLMLKAMKMENPIFAPIGGSVVEIHVKEGNSVISDRLLLSLFNPESFLMSKTIE